MHHLVQTAQNLRSNVKLDGKFLLNSFVLTAGAFNYRGALYNWIRHMESQNLRNYIVLCFDEKVYEIVGPVHGVLMTNGMNYMVSNVTIAENSNTLGWKSPPNIKKNAETIKKEREAKVKLDRRYRANSTQLKLRQRIRNNKESQRALKNSSRQSWRSWLESSVMIQTPSDVRVFMQGVLLFIERW